jgi:hypothetical protein
MSADNQFLRLTAMAETAREANRLDGALCAGLLASWLAVVAEIARDVLDPTEETDVREGQEMLLESFQRLTQAMGVDQGKSRGTP